MAGEQPDAERGMEAPAPMSRAAMAAVALVGLLAVAWFVVSWRVLGSPLVDAVGEAAGGILALLVIVSIFGAVRRPGD
jgi:hypothetical protein